MPSFVDQVIAVASEAVLDGGFVMPPLAAITVTLWWALGERAWTLRPALLVEAAARCDAVAGDDGRAPRGLLQVALAGLEDQARRGATLVRSLVIIAPLLGLLGTVTGMIETFDALADMALFRQGGGVAGGVSQALLSTQAGLCVAVPGLLLGKLLDRVQRRRLDELDLLLTTRVRPEADPPRGTS